MDKALEKANILIEAIPYIKKFTGKTFVIKYGGSAMIDEDKKKLLIEDIVLFKLLGIDIVIVHGGGPFIKEALDKLGKDAQFIDGLRVTDDETMEIVEMVLSGSVNKEIANSIQKNGIPSVGISGKDGNLLKAKKIEIENGDLGFVGDIESVDPSIIKTLLQQGFIPVVSPVAKDENFDTYNINADYAAAEIAGSLNAEKLIFVTDILGVMRDVNDKDSLIHYMDLDVARKNIEDGIITGGMIPKVECCISAVERGTKQVHIINGNLPHSMILEIFTKQGIGTMFIKGGQDE
ncbi:acetylglutamate kinase [Tissierella creatinophila]|uniref:Acetylglutamate kinase n=1 Tax=Tissierella creatinophila DSM 6911 TaxID=1123403 RepID=A0A1U7M5F8_TISCR|nr:acetylglutamate kinase [Tissierella creatinophila]OLS02515.1 acetylglutamate kinase [Tissierella creatinophila DSM 6911]